MPISALTKEDFKPRKAQDAARHFGEKTALPSDLFERLSAEAKNRAFRIAGVHKVRLVQRAREIVRKAIREGTPFGEVRRQLLALFEVEGIPRPALTRLQIMFQQNVMQAYNDARREVLDSREIASAFPYRMYMTVGNGTPGVRGVRPTHAALHRKVFAWNDPFWDSHTPPGRTHPPAASGSGGGRKEEELIANALKEHDGRYGEALFALQKRLIDEECERTGLERKRAVRLLEKQYPVIFGEAA